LGAGDVDVFGSQILNVIISNFNKQETASM